MLLSGGSAYGFDAATGVMRWLEERGHGFPIPTGVVPIVPGAILIDLSIGNPMVRPDADAGYAACEAATAGGLEEGCVGAGTGATVAKALGMEGALKGGIGSAAEKTASGVTVAALIAVNSFGEVVEAENGRVVAGPRGEAAGSFVSTLEALRARPPLSPFTVSPSNSTIGVVATDAALTKDEAYRLAVMAQTGLTHAIRPAHTPGGRRHDLRACHRDEPGGDGRPAAGDAGGEGGRAGDRAGGDGGEGAGGGAFGGGVEGGIRGKR